jgi:putative DNA primase/helicase
VSEQLLPIFWGKGANGKSTLINVMLALLGPDYAMKAAEGLLLSKGRESHPTEKADLFGKRFVATSETDEGRHLSEALIKDLTGGERQRARRMREDFWEFNPTHKIALSTNHKPRVRDTGNGMWRRLRLVPFTVTFWDPDNPEEKAKGLPEELKQDKRLSEKLATEMPGIFNWLIQGCLEWQRDGMTTPKAVMAATAEYRNAEDMIGRFVAERCAVGRDFRVKASTFREAYARWWEDFGEGDMPSPRKLWSALTEYMDARNAHLESFPSNGTWYRGLMLQAQTNADASQEDEAGGTEGSGARKNGKPGIVVRIGRAKG